MDIKETLNEREIQHGPFNKHALIESQFRMILEHHSDNLNYVQYIALGMIFHKCARILNGGQQHSDTWHDIAGYAILAEQEILDE